MRIIPRITPVKRKTIYKYGISQAELARRLGLRPQQVGYVLDGVRHTPHIQESVAKYFGKPVEELFGRGAWTKIYKRRGRVKAQRNGNTPPAHGPRLRREASEVSSKGGPAPLGRGEITKKEGRDRDGQ